MQADQKEVMPYEQLPAIDRILTRHIMKRYQLSSAVEPIVLYLVTATRNGHLCCEFREGGFEPDPEVLWGEGEWREVIAEAYSALKNSNISGLQVEGTRIYLPAQWKVVEELRNKIRSLINEPPELVPNRDKMDQILLELLHQKKVEPEQGEAIDQSSRNVITLISGGPGTGKTYTAGMVIRTLLNTIETDRPVEISLAAPTGKAASQLHGSILRALGEEGKGVVFQTKTLHALLGRRRGEKVSSYLSSDIVLIDESSMVDAGLFLDLLNARKKGSRLILLGDPYQLPPVESGSIFADLIRMGLPGVQLVKCLRAEMVQLIEFAGKIKAGDYVGANQVIARGREGDPIYRHEGDPIEFAVGKYPKNFDKPIEKLFEEFQKFRILTPINRGKMGVDELNRQCKERFLKNAKERFVVPVMITTNDYRQGLFNGEMGLLEIGAPFDRIKPGDVAYFAERGEEGVRKFPALTLPANQVAYALSVHKSQGSEFSEVYIVMPEGAESLSREVVYTAVTRAKRTVVMNGGEEAMKEALGRRSERVSGLGEKFSVT